MFPRPIRKVCPFAYDSWRPTFHPGFDLPRIACTSVLIFVPVLGFRVQEAGSRVVLAHKGAAKMAFDESLLGRRSPAGSVGSSILRFFHSSSQCRDIPLFCKVLVWAAPS